MLRKLQFAALIAIVAMICSENSFAQTGYAKTQNINASANIFATITLASAANVDFSNINVGQIPTIDPTVAASSWTNVGASATLGGFTVAGSNGANVTVSWTTQDLSDGASHSVTYSPLVSYGATQVGSTSVTSGTTHIPLGATAMPLYIGGHLYQQGTSNPVPAGQTAGTYTGTVTFTVDYVL